MDLWLFGGGVGSVCHRYSAFFYMWNILGVMVLHRSMFVWRRGWGQSAIGICAFCYMWNIWSVMVLHRSMPNWRRGWGQSTIGICACFYLLFGVMVFQRSMLNWRRGQGQSVMKLIWCSGLPDIYAQLGGYLCIMCILLYVRLMGCNCVVWIYGWLARGGVMV